MADTLLMVDPKVPGSGFRIPRGQLSQAQSDGMRLGEEWQNKDGERYYYPLAGRGDAVKAGLSRPAGSKAHSEEELSETIPPLDTSTDPPPDIGVMDRVRQGVSGALGDPGALNVANAVAGAAPGAVMYGLGEGGSAVSRVAGGMMDRMAPSPVARALQRKAKSAASSTAKNTDGMLQELVDKLHGKVSDSLVRKIMKGLGWATSGAVGTDYARRTYNDMNRTE